MFLKSVAITLLYVNHALVHCAYTNRESSKELIRECCLRNNADIIHDHQNRCDFEDLNDTSTMISYESFDNESDISCCSACFEKSFELQMNSEETTRKQGCTNVNATSNIRRSCFKVCILNGQSIWKEWKEWKHRGSEETNDSFVRINKSNENEVESWHCDSIFTSLNFWGANIVIFANIIYIVPYVIVVVVYYTVPGLNTRAYNKAVICYNASQIILNGILIGIGACVLCHVSIYSNVLIILGLSIMFLTISSTFWLFVICIDMTLVITRFRCTSPSDTSQRDEKQKFLTYATWTWGGSLLPTTLAGIAELSPWLSISSPVRPNFKQFRDGANLSVIIYVATFPALTCLANTILFCYTSYKMILIQRSTTLATANSTLKINTIRKRYFIFLRLYLLMDAPWITSALAAAFTDLWLLKFLRMIQPILMLLAILPPGTASRAFACNHLLRKSCRIFKFGQSS